MGCMNNIEWMMAEWMMAILYRAAHFGTLWHTITLKNDSYLYIDSHILFLKYIKHTKYFYN